MTGLEILAAVSVATSVIGGITSAMGASQEAAARQSAANYNIAVANRNRQMALNQAASDAGDVEVENRRQLGAIRAAYGASGLAIEGTPLDVIESVAIEQQLNIGKVLYKGKVAAMDETDKATQFRMQADEAGRAGSFGVAGALLKGVIGAGTAGFQAFGGGSRGAGTSLTRTAQGWG